MKNLRIQVLLLSLLLLTPGIPLQAAPDLGETLDYTVTFRGLVTGFVELNIAKVTLSVGPRIEPVSARPAYVARLQVSTEPYKKAELLYPLRFDYRSWLDQQTLQSLMASKYVVTGETRREFYWYDPEHRQGYHYQTPDEKAAQPGKTPPDRLLQVASLDDPDWSDLQENLSIALERPDIVDYLGMLHRLRRIPSRPKEWYEFTVFSGKKLVPFRVQVERERLIRRGWDRDTLHLRLFEYDPDKDRLEEAVQLWLSDDDQRRLLRFYAEGAVGALEGILETGRPENGHNEGLSESTRQSLENYLDF